MHSEIGKACGLVDAIELFQAIDFGGGDFGNLRFVGVKSGDGFGYRTIANDFTEGFDDGLRAG